MRRWFLSYHSPDQMLAERLKAAIERQDTGSRVFLSATSLRAGGYWQPALAQAIEEAEAFVLLVGQHGLGDWQAPEYYAAQDRQVKSPGFPVVLMLLDGQAAPGLPFLRQLHWIVSVDPASEKDVARLLDAAAGADRPTGELWRHAAPYRGLHAMEEKDADYFFGRERETVEVLGALAETPDRLPLLLGNSGVGKSSLAQAGVMAALRRQGWPERATVPVAWPAVFAQSRGWCFLALKPGADPVHALVDTFVRTWQYDVTDPQWEERHSGWVERLLDGRASLPGLLDATERRYEQLGQPRPPAFLLYIDQGEELYARAEERQRIRFSELIVQALGDPRLRALMSLRADFFGELQKDAPLFGAHRLINVPPLREEQLREVVSCPAQMLTARFEPVALSGDIAGRAAEESTKAAGALPLLSYLLDDMWSQMVERGDGTLRLSTASIDLGRVLAERANVFLAGHPKSEDALRRLLTLKLATVREDGEPTRRRALRSECTDEEWRLVSELADHPYRLLAIAMPEGGETYAEVAHEAIFRRWERLREWIAAEKDFLAWRSGLERDRRRWEGVPGGAKTEALLSGYALAQAQSWLAQRGGDLLPADRDFVEQSIKRDAADRAQREGQRRRMWQMATLAGVLVLGIAAGLGWSSRDYMEARAVVLAEMVWPKTLSASAERALQPGQAFRECAHCPEMVLIPAGEFMMGSPEGVGESDARPQHKVTIARAFAVSRFEVTSDEWDACVLLGGCAWPAPETGWGRGRRPVMNVYWEDAGQYVTWLSKRTGKTYRLLSEAEWEYAARAGSDKIHSWGDPIQPDGKAMANCNRCGSEWDYKRTAPVGSFPANAFGLHDMHGNVFELVEDCWHDNYAGNPPTDGSVWAGGNCSRRVVRGGSYLAAPDKIGAAYRGWNDDRSSALGLRIGRTLLPP